MEALKLVAAALALISATRCDARAGYDWHPYVTEASLRFGVPIPWIERVISAESNGHAILDGRPIRSRAGAIGLMQVMPATWNMLRRSLALGTNPDDPHDNIIAGTLYLRMMYDRFGFPAMFAAYNAGPTRFATYLATARSLPRETIAYFHKVTDPTVGATFLATEPKTGALFVDKATAQLTSLPSAKGRSRYTLFVVLHDGL